MGRPVFKAPPRPRSEPAARPAKRARTASPPHTVLPANAPANAAAVAAPDDNAGGDNAGGDNAQGASMLAARHAPQTSAELALHASKLDELVCALDPSARTRVVVLSGPAGASKSSAVRVVCREQQRALLEFVAPESAVGATGLMGSFREFLVGAAMHAREAAVVLVDELPNVFHEDTRRQFEEALVDWARERAPQPVLVVAFTEIEVSAHYSEAAVVPRVLGTLVALTEHCRWIKTNAVNATLVTRALRRVLARERAACPPAVVREIAQCGDVRNAITALELYLKAPAGDARALVRGFPVQLFHAVGKVVWGTAKEGSLEQALDAFADTLDTFNLTVLENYGAAHHSRLALAAAVRVADALSEADLGLPELGALAAAHAIHTSAPDVRAPRRFESLRFTQHARWRREEHETRARLIARVKDRRLYEGPASVACAALDEFAYEPLLRARAEPVPDFSSSDDDF